MTHDHHNPTRSIILLAFLAAAAIALHLTYRAGRWLFTRFKCRLPPISRPVTPRNPRRNATYPKRGKPPPNRRKTMPPTIALDDAGIRYLTYYVLGLDSPDHVWLQRSREEPATNNARLAQYLLRRAAYRRTAK